MTTGNRSGLPARRKWAAVLAVIVLVLAAGGYGFYRVEAQHIRRDKYNELAAIGELKAGEIARWRQERLDDVLEDAESLFVVKAVEAWLKDSGNLALRDGFLQRLKLAQKTEAVADALLLGVDGRILLAAKDDPDPVDAATMWAVARALEGKRAVLTDLFRCPRGEVHLDAVAPMLDANNQPVAVVVLRSDATQFLYPLLQSWPIPRGSAETLLVRKEGDDILFLNELRHRSGAALSLRVPLTQSGLLCVQAVAGKQGMFEGKDYRGVEVLADLRPVPGSPWFMVAKVDASEFLAEVNYRAGVIVGFVVLSILLSAFVAAFLYRQRQVRLYRALHALEREKRKAEELLRATLVGIGDAVIAADERGFVAFMNPVAETLTGWPQVEALGKPLSQVFHIVNAQTRERCENPVEKVLARGRVVGLANDTVLIARDGTERRIADSGAPIRDGGGSVIGVVLVFRDVTEEYRMHEALRESEERFRKVFEEGPLGMVMASTKDGRFLKANAAFCQMVGYTEEELQRLTFADVTHPEHRDEDVEAVKKLWAGQIPRYATEKRYLKKNGETIWGSLTASVIPGEDGKPLYSLAIIEDISERKRAEEETRRLAELLDFAPSSITVHDFDGHFLYANQRTLEMHGYSRDEFLALNLHQVDVPDSEALIASRVREVSEKGEARFEVAHFRKDGTTVPLEVCARMTTWGDRRVILNVGTDIAERRRAEEALRVALVKYKTLFDFFPLGITVSDEAGNVLETNSNAEKLLGVRQEEHVGRAIDGPDWRIVRPDGTPMPSDEYASVRALREKRAVENVEMGIVKPDNTITWINVTAAPLPLEGHGVAVTYGDITERKRAEEALRESESRYRRITEGLTDYQYTVRVENGRAVETTQGPACAAVTGYTAEEFAADPHLWVRMVAPEDRELVRSRVQQVLAGKEIPPIEHRIVRKDGETRWMCDATILHKDAFGNLLSYDGVIKDITERKRAEEALRESEEKFRTLFNQIPDGVYRSTHAGRFVDVNPALVKMFGYDSREEMLALDIGKDLYFSHEEREAEFLEALQAGISVFRLRRKDGSEIWVEDHGDYVYDEQGNILFHEGILRDITDRKRAEEALRESGARFRILFDRANDGILILSLDGRLVSVNESFAHMHGYSVEEMQHMSLKDLGTPETFQRVPERMARVGAGEPLTFEVEHYHKDGHVFPLEVSASLISSGGESFIQCFHRDITKRKRAERALRESEARYAALFEHNPMETIVVDLNGRIQAFNRAKRESGDRLPQIGGMMYRDYAGKHTIDMHRELMHCIQSGELRHYPERPYGPRILAIDIAPFADGAIITARDITDRKRAEERVRDFSRRLLSVREEDKRRLSSVLHHEVGSFTVGVMAQLDAAEDGLRAGKSEEVLASLKECRRVFSESVKRLKSQAVELRPPDLDILGLGAALRQHFLQLSRETSLRIHFSDATHGAAITPEVQTVLFRAAQECLNNVVQHARAAHARVRLSASEQGIRLSLADDGKGFDPGEVAQRSGAHLGLRAVQEMVATLGGMLDIASKPGKGTKVTVTIPGRGDGEGGRWTVNSDQ